MTVTGNDLIAPGAFVRALGPQNSAGPMAIATVRAGG